MIFIDISNKYGSEKDSILCMRIWTANWNTYKSELLEVEGKVHS